jgi:putative toxin-antitoxin system antitoxin component (TIGR02293 family)
LAQIVKTLDLDIQRQERLFAVSKSTLHRLAKERKRLNPAISDRIARLMRIYAEVMELFDDSEDAKRWLYQPHRILRGSAPIDLLDTDAGTLEVEDMLNGLRYGVYS